MQESVSLRFSDFCATLGEFSICGSGESCEDAISLSYERLHDGERVEALALENFVCKENELEKYAEIFNEIASCGCKIYFFLRDEQFCLQNYKYYVQLASFGLVIATRLRETTNT